MKTLGFSENDFFSSIYLVPDPPSEPSEPGGDPQPKPPKPIRSFYL